LAKVALCYLSVARHDAQYQPIEKVIANKGTAKGNVAVGER
jgi:hypothetical protein